MQFKEFGTDGKPVILGMHGMCQKWESVYDILKPLENDFKLIIPAMDGFYDGSLSEFTSFSDQARQIEEYVNKNYNGQIDGIYGISQGGLMVIEILSRGNISINKAVTDGVYVAHHGKLAGRMVYRLLRFYKKNNRPPKVMDIMVKLMGLDPKDAYEMFDFVYWSASLESIRKNVYENYTYHVDSNLANTNTMVYLLCGSKEPYAKKSHKILKRYLKNYDEKIVKDLGHAEYAVRHNDELCHDLIRFFSDK